MRNIWLYMPVLLLGTQCWAASVALQQSTSEGAGAHLVSKRLRYTPPPSAAVEPSLRKGGSFDSIVSGMVGDMWAGQPVTKGSIQEALIAATAPGIGGGTLTEETADAVRRRIAHYQDRMIAQATRRGKLESATLAIGSFIENMGIALDEGASPAAVNAILAQVTSDYVGAPLV